MSIITDLKPQKNKMRINLFLDGSYFCGLQRETILINKLKIGDYIDREKLENIQLESEKNKAFENALKLLDRKQYTESELTLKLKSKGYLEGTIKYAIDKLSNYGYIDDKTYTKNYIKLNKSKSKRELLNKLSQKGVKADVIEGEICKVTKEQEQENCMILSQKYTKNKLKTFDNKVKTYRYLLSKGYDFDTAKTCVNDIFVNIEEGDND